MDYERIEELLLGIAVRYELSEDEYAAIEKAAAIVREKPYTRTIGQVQRIVDGVRAGYDVQIEYFDPELEADGTYDCCYIPTY